MSAASILVYGHEARLLETRRWVLEKAGFVVHATTDLREAMELVQRGPELLILCHTLSDEDRGRVLSEVRGLRLATKVLLLTTHPTVEQEDDGVEILRGFIGPRMLLTAVEKALGA